MLPDLPALGTSEHFLTDYDDEANYTLPWDLFTEESAREALVAGRRSVKAAKNSIEAIKAWQKEQSEEDKNFSTIRGDGVHPGAFTN